MKKAILILTLAGALMMVNTGMATSQEKPVPKKDTVNRDTDAKPTFYYAVEDDKAGAPTKSSSGSAGTIIMIVGAVVIVGATAFFFFRKRK